MNTTSTAVPTPGFADPPTEGQRVFRAILDALAHPGRSYRIAGPAQAPEALGTGLAAVALTLFDEEVSVWLHRTAAENPDVTSYLAFHTGARVATGHGSANFVLATPDTLPALDELALGTDDAPHQSATVVLDARTPGVGARFTATGPGIDGQAEIEAPWAPAGFLAAWTRNGALFPRGVDLLVASDDRVLALPRTTRLRAVSDQGQEA
ncbi:phosphonate C-P lyase system protein PhnH [Streptomyces rugosispiralis]|uniref:Phosphonate C-P lyase system protein PhnH n=1 Tax=Streptomyces rugosispiralis TaxID=2967341 RepID=A0ABT1UP40_9ACTN|nr:phosphonate C-P lyase system protein PhnH [Streptomyces rugosispiralis]MCQ8186904.1 phosphonate C-P lyase system protein PhnH [Streptomyces rugosispiralis]